MHAQQHGFGNRNLTIAALGSATGSLHLQHPRLVPESSNYALYRPIPHIGNLSRRVMLLHCGHIQSGNIVKLAGGILVLALTIC